MKAKTDKKHVMFAILALLTTMVVLLLAAVPAMAGPVHLNVDVSPGFVGVDPHTLGHILDQVESLDGGSATPSPEGIDPHLAFPHNPAFDGPFPSILDDIVPGDEADGADEEVDEADEAEETTETDEAEEVDEADDSDEVEGDESEEATEDEEDENDEVTEEEAGEEDDGDEPTLPYTGGDSTPWLIAGAAVILAGALMVTRRRNGDSRR